MENDRRVQANVDGHSQLPKEIIQHIQHFLTAKEAAQTTVLSKRWFNSWLSRSTLDFDEHHFCKPGSQIGEDFVPFVNRSISRYEESQLTIEKFCLRMNIRDCDLASLVCQWIVKAVGMGVKYMYIDVKPPGFMVLPKEVFKAKSLENLVVYGCKVGGHSEEKVMCFNLKQLELHSSRVVDSMIEDIFSKCTLLENVILSYCVGLREDVNVSKLLNLREVNFSSLSNQRKPKIFTRFHDMTPGSAVGRRIFKTLTDLVLSYVKIDPVMQIDFSVIFPCIKKLTIRNCRSCKVLGITSKSLEVITCEGMFTVAKLIIPCIKFFKFKGANIPILTFTQCSKKWESDISLTGWHPDDSWFRELKSFLSELSESKISLNLSIIGRVIDLVGDLQLQSSPKPAVENLRLVYDPEIVSKEVCSMIWDNLLWSFSPKFINYKQHPKSNNVRGNEKYEEFWEDFTRRMLDQHFIGMAEGLLLIRGLDGVDLELFEHPRAEWQPLPWETFFDDSTIPAAGRNVRFRLRWKPCANAGAHYR